MHNMDRLSTIKTFNSRIEAEIAKSYLESFDIKAEIFSDDAGQSIISLQSVRGVKLLTNRKYLQKARRLLDKKNLSNE
ncbi:unnamed protein product [marine sediment metagenome]|uniref:DUF2007 domain-containing protein n=1 Tax=marine sediment metagenome TaxID=412755 RepID=X1N5V3_9ZZZZ